MICQVGSIGSGQSSSMNDVMLYDAQSDASYAAFVPHGI